ncbi:MAG TPA: nuclease-related domain-containing protein [Streptosporangiaceae bacterium]|nr:nuclease-related domain-containing protein [Streptosporangiaceae bacterium]
MDRETGPEPTAVRPAQPAGSLDDGLSTARPAGPASLVDPADEAATADRAEPDSGGRAATAADPLDEPDDEPESDDASWQVRHVGFPSRLIVAQLSADPRVPIWTRRAVGVLIIALGFGVWLGWRYGLTIAALAAILDTVYQSKTVSLIPAAARVAFAQRRTRHRLLLLRPWGYHALHSRPIPGTESIIDHLVVGPGGVFAVDSERWDRRLPVRTVASNSAAGPVLYHGPFSQKQRLAHARWEAAQATHLLSRELQRQVTVRPAMVIYGPAVPWTVARLRGVDVFSGRSVVRYFARQTRARGETAMNWEQVGEIVAAAERALPRR